MNPPSPGTDWKHCSTNSDGVSDQELVHPFKSSMKSKFTDLFDVKCVHLNILIILIPETELKGF